jgi:hypothetical protein
MAEGTYLSLTQLLRVQAALRLLPSWPIQVVEIQLRRIQRIGDNALIYWGVTVTDGTTIHYPAVASWGVYAPDGQAQWDDDSLARAIWEECIKLAMETLTEDSLASVADRLAKGDANNV